MSVLTLQAWYLQNWMAIQEAARTYLDTANYVKVTLMPEAK